jgi:uncharacterized protein (TIGR02246 family)
LGTDVEAEVSALFRLNDERWRALDFEGVAALWDPDEPAPFYVGDEYAEPQVGWDQLQRHWARHAARLCEAEVESSVRQVALLAPELAVAVVLWTWSFTGVESPVRHTGRSWVTAVLRRGAAGWRFTHQAETPTYARSDEAG